MRPIAVLASPFTRKVRRTLADKAVGGLVPASTT
jgi:hypothetical protein